MKKVLSTESGRIFDYLLIIPALIMALAPAGMEERMNIKFLGYDFFVFTFLGLFALSVRLLSHRTGSVDKCAIALALTALVFDIRFFSDNYFAHFAIGTEFVIGYLFAKNIKYTKKVLFFIYNSSFALLLLVLLQQVSFAFGLGYFSSGQQEIELTDGVYRVGTTIGGSTYTGVFVVLLAGILLVLTKSQLIRYAIILLAIFSSILSGTRSSMIVILLIGAYMLVKTKGVSNFYKIIAFVAFLVLLLPSLERVVEVRNEAAELGGADLTSGRTERWTDLFEYMNQDQSRYLVGNGGGTVPISNHNKHIKVLASPHNGYLGMLFEYGILGLLFLLVFLYKKVRPMFGHYSEGFIALVFSLLVSWNSEVITLSFLYSFYFWLLYFVEINTNESYVGTSLKRRIV
jgi:hypothetical protein